MVVFSVMMRVGGHVLFLSLIWVWGLSYVSYAYGETNSIDPVTQVSQNTNTMSATQRFVKKELEMVRIDEKVGSILDADLNFYDQEGNTVPLSSFLDESPLVLSFAYYSCTLICQFVLQGQVDVFNQMDLIPGVDFKAVTISFDPTDEAALTEKMSETYADKIHRNDEGRGEWTFLYGQEGEIKNVTEQLGFYYDIIKATGEFAHSAAIYVITPKGKISRYFYGIQFNPLDLKLAIIEAKAENTRSGMERILMYCYQYDADSRGYALSARKIMKAGGLVTVAIIGMFLVFANSSRITLIRKK